MENDMTMKPGGPLAAYILIDRSGSMTRRWKETLDAVTAYVTGLVEEGQGNARVSVIAFDGHGQDGLDFHVLRDDYRANEFKPISSTEAWPRGYTPLYDACVRLAAMAEEFPHERTVLAVITDGEENSSREAKRETAKAAFDRLRERGWQIVFLGVDFEAFKDAESVGVGFGSTITASSATLGATMRSYAAHSSLYASDGVDVEWSTKDRATAAGEKAEKSPRQSARKRKDQ